MPYIVHSASIYSSLPMLIMGILAVISGIASLLLPETFNQYLPETLEEAELHGIVGKIAIQSHWNRFKSFFQKNKKNSQQIQQNTETSLNLMKNEQK